MQQLVATCFTVGLLALASAETFTSDGIETPYCGYYKISTDSPPDGCTFNPGTGRVSGTCDSNVYCGAFSGDLLQACTYAAASNDYTFACNFDYVLEECGQHICESQGFSQVDSVTAIPAYGEPSVSEADFCSSSREIFKNQYIEAGTGKLTSCDTSDFSSGSYGCDPAAKNTLTYYSNLNSAASAMCALYGYDDTYKQFSAMMTRNSNYMAMASSAVGVQVTCSGSDTSDRNPETTKGILIESDGSQLQPYCSFRSTCGSIGDSERERCAEGLCKASGFTKGSYYGFTGTEFTCNPDEKGTAIEGAYYIEIDVSLDAVYRDSYTRFPGNYGRILASCEDPDKDAQERLAAATGGMPRCNSETDYIVMPFGTCPSTGFEMIYSQFLCDEAARSAQPMNLLIASTFGIGVSSTGDIDRGDVGSTDSGSFGGSSEGADVFFGETFYTQYSDSCQGTSEADTEGGSDGSVQDRSSIAISDASKPQGCFIDASSGQVYFNANREGTSIIGKTNDWSTDFNAICACHERADGSGGSCPKHWFKDDDSTCNKVFDDLFDGSIDFCDGSCSSRSGDQFGFLEDGPSSSFDGGDMSSGGDSTGFTWFAAQEACKRQGDVLSTEYATKDSCMQSGLPFPEDQAGTCGSSTTGDEDLPILVPDDGVGSSRQSQEQVCDDLSSQLSCSKVNNCAWIKVEDADDAGDTFMFGLSKGADCTLSCENTLYGCCDDSTTTKVDEAGSNCVSDPRASQAYDDLTIKCLSESGDSCSDDCISKNCGVEDPASTEDCSRPPASDQAQCIIRDCATISNEISFSPRTLSDTDFEVLDEFAYKRALCEGGVGPGLQALLGTESCEWKTCSGKTGCYATSDACFDGDSGSSYSGGDPGDISGGDPGGAGLEFCQEGLICTVKVGSLDQGTCEELPCCEPDDDVSDEDTGSLSDQDKYFICMEIFDQTSCEDYDFCYYDVDYCRARTCKDDGEACSASCCDACAGEFVGGVPTDDKGFTNFDAYFGGLNEIVRNSLCDCYADEYDDDGQKMSHLGCYDFPDYSDTVSGSFDDALAPSCTKCHACRYQAANTRNVSLATVDSLSKTKLIASQVEQDKGVWVGQFYDRTDGKVKWDAPSAQAVDTPVPPSVSSSEQNPSVSISANQGCLAIVGTKVTEGTSGGGGFDPSDPSGIDIGPGGGGGGPGGGGPGGGGPGGVGGGGSASPDGGSAGPGGPGGPGSFDIEGSGGSSFGDEAIDLDGEPAQWVYKSCGEDLSFYACSFPAPEELPQNRPQYFRPDDDSSGSAFDDRSGYGSSVCCSATCYDAQGTFTESCTCSSCSCTTGGGQPGLYTDSSCTECQPYDYYDEITLPTYQCPDGSGSGSGTGVIDIQSECESCHYLYKDSNEPKQIQSILESSSCKLCGCDSEENCFGPEAAASKGIVWKNMAGTGLYESDEGLRQDEGCGVNFRTSFECDSAGGGCCHEFGSAEAVVDSDRTMACMLQNDCTPRGQSCSENDVSIMRTLCPVSCGIGCDNDPTDAPDTTPSATTEQPEEFCEAISCITECQSPCGWIHGFGCTHDAEAPREDALRMLFGCPGACKDPLFVGDKEDPLNQRWLCNDVNQEPAPSLPDDYIDSTFVFSFPIEIAERRAKRETTQCQNTAYFWHTMSTGLKGLTDDTPDCDVFFTFNCISDSESVSADATFPPDADSYCVDSYIEKLVDLGNNEEKIPGTNFHIMANDECPTLYSTQSAEAYTLDLEYNEGDIRSWADSSTADYKANLCQSLKQLASFYYNQPCAATECSGSGTSFAMVITTTASTESVDFLATFISAWPLTSNLQGSFFGESQVFYKDGEGDIDALILDVGVPFPLPKIEMVKVRGDSKVVTTSTTTTTLPFDPSACYAINGDICLTNTQNQYIIREKTKDTYECATDQFLGSNVYTDIDPNTESNCNICDDGLGGPGCFISDAYCQANGDSGAYVKLNGECVCSKNIGGEKCQYNSFIHCKGKGFIQPDGSCICIRGYTGNQCQYSDAKTCNEQGTVQYDGSCRCFSGYTGANCDAVVTCPASCFGKTSSSVQEGQFYCNTVSHKCVMKLPSANDAATATSSGEDNTTTYIIIIVCVVVILIVGAVGYVMYAARKKAKENETMVGDYMTNQMFDMIDQAGEGDDAGDGKLSVEEFMSFAAKDGRAKPQVNLDSKAKKATTGAGAQKKKAQKASHGSAVQNPAYEEAPQKATKQAKAPATASSGKPASAAKPASSSATASKSKSSGKAAAASKSASGSVDKSSGKAAAVSKPASAPVGGAKKTSGKASAKSSSGPAGGAKKTSAKASAKSSSGPAGDAKKTSGKASAKSSSGAKKTSGKASAKSSSGPAGGAKKSSGKASAGANGAADKKSSKSSENAAKSGAPVTKKVKPTRTGPPKVGDRVTVEGYDVPGTVAFVGNHAEKNLPRVGVELDKPVGKHSGTVGGHKYFKCAKGKGVLVLPNKVKFL